MRTAAGIGRVYVWDGGSLLIGRSTGTTDIHAHHAIQITLTPDPAVRFRSRKGDWTEYRGAIIEPDHPHAFDGRGTTVAHIFVEPESREGRAITERMGRGGIAELAEQDRALAVPMLFGPWVTTRDEGPMVLAARSAIRHFAGGVEPATPVDERVSQAVAYMKAHINRPLTLDQVAAAVHLSPGRFRHLFVEQTAMTLRGYVLWLRFQRAWKLIAAGNTLTAAAHGAGFADSAHLSRTSRRMFGIAPVGLKME